MAGYMPRTFGLTADHVKLLRASYVQGQLSDWETGGAEISGKRPYGNSDVATDVMELLGWDLTVMDEDRPDYEPHDAENLRALAMELHEQTPVALQIVLCTGSFEPGTYSRPDEYNTQHWVKS